MRYVIVVIVLVCGLGILFVFNSDPRWLTIFNRQPSIARDNSEIFSDEKALRSYIQAYGIKDAIRHLHELSATQGSCHDAAHRAGRIAYAFSGDKAFTECSSECHSGCYHGATEAYFKEHGTSNIAENLSLLCGDELNAFFSHQCIHGVGHGLMAWANYSLPEALAACDTLPERADSCWTGVFMENIVGTLGGESGHYTRYLNDDPLYPCTDVEDKYKSSCYFLQTSRMLQIFPGDFAKVGESCMKAPEGYRSSCFGSMGRDVGGSFRGNPNGAIEACANAPYGQLRRDCLVGAAQDTFWDPEGAPHAVAFCTLLTDLQEKDACYETIFGRASEVLTDAKQKQMFCDSAEESYTKRCITVVN